jgi:3',5'-cyclic AMP phosphodiesterase CpdA
MRIALIADSHLAARAPESLHNWHAAAAEVARLAPTLTVHLGDISLDGERHPEELELAAALVAAWPTPILRLPGNHDMGTASGEEPLSPARLARYRDLFGDDHWSVGGAGWTLIGLNAQLLGSASTAEASQWQWLASEAAALAAGNRVALFTHRPLRRVAGDVGMATGRYVAPAAAARLRDGRLGAAIELVVSGHTHQALDVAADGVRHLWLPSSSFYIDDSRQVPIGEKRVGIGLLTLAAGVAPSYEPILPPGMRRHELTRLACFAEFVAAH